MKPKFANEQRSMSGWLEAARDDLQRIEDLPDVVVNMRTFLSSGSDGKCHVCLAGAMLYRRCDPASLPIDFNAWSSTLPSERWLLDMVDSLRGGDLRHAIACADHIPELLDRETRNRVRTVVRRFGEGLSLAEILGQPRPLPVYPARQWQWAKGDTTFYTQINRTIEILKIVGL